MPSLTALGGSVLAGSPGCGLATEPAVGAAILEQLRGFGARGSVLYLAASVRFVVESRLMQIHHTPWGRKWDSTP